MKRDIYIETKVLARNDAVAEKNRKLFDELGAYVVNLISSPGTGKTTLVTATARNLADKLRAGVIEGDVQTENDAVKIAATGIPVEAIVTGGACHLDAPMVRSALERLTAKVPEGLDMVVIENVGNLVCPSSYDLGEDEKVALVSVTEGEDKPEKYPALFHNVSTCLITKIDLIPHLDFDLEALKESARSVNPELRFFTVSAKTGEGLDEWIDYLVERANLRSATGE